MYKRDWCHDTGSPLSHYFFELSFSSFVFLGLATILGVLIKVAAAIPEIAGSEGRVLLIWWYVFMWPLMACFLLTCAGIGTFLLTNVMIVRMVYPDFAIFEQYAAGVGDETPVWVESQTILWGAVGSFGVSAVALLLASVLIVACSNCSRSNRAQVGFQDSSGV